MSLFDDRRIIEVVRSKLQGELEQLVQSAMVNVQGVVLGEMAAMRNRIEEQIQGKVDEIRDEHMQEVSDLKASNRELFQKLELMEGRTNTLQESVERSMRQNLRKMDDVQGVLNELMQRDLPKKLSKTEGESRPSADEQMREKMAERARRFAAPEPGVVTRTAGKEADGTHTQKTIKLPPTGDVQTRTVGSLVARFEAPRVKDAKSAQPATESSDSCTSAFTRARRVHQAGADDCTAMIVKRQQLTPLSLLDYLPQPNSSHSAHVAH